MINIQNYLTLIMLVEKWNLFCDVIVDQLIMWHYFTNNDRYIYFTCKNIYILTFQK